MLDIAGSDKPGLFESGYTLRLTTHTTGALKIYLINMPVYLGTEPSSWGRIKKIHM